MTHADINGLDRCMCRRPAQDIADRQVWMMLNAEFPGLLQRVHELRGAGERLLIPQSVEGARERAMRLDDGDMSVAELARTAGVAYGTAWAARRQEKSRE